MNDVGKHLSALLDDAAASIQPRPDFEAVRAASVPVVANPAPGGRRFRSAFGAAAAAVALLGGGVVLIGIVVLVIAGQRRMRPKPLTS